MKKLILHYGRFGGGWADRMRIWVTARGLAEITGREFRISFEEMDDPPELVNWGPLYDKPPEWGKNWELTWESHDFFGTDDLNARWGDEIYILGNKMWLHLLRQNPHYSIPNYDEWVIGLFRRFYQEVKVNIQPLPAEVGIQIRAGDDWMGVKYDPKSNGVNFLQLESIQGRVREISRAIREMGLDKSTIFITSDYDGIYDMFDFPNKVYNGSPAYHYDTPGFLSRGGAGSMTDRVQGLTKTIGDHLTLINCKVIFFSPWSGFGNTAALISQTDQTYEMSRHISRTDILRRLEG